MPLGVGQGQHVRLKIFATICCHRGIHVSQTHVQFKLFTRVRNIMKVIYLCSVRRTQVIDDESDYFSTDNKWLSKSDRDKLKKREDQLRAKRFDSQKNRTISLDFAGRQVIEEDSSANTSMYDVSDDVIQEIHFGAKPKHIRKQEENLNDLVNPTIPVDAPKVCLYKQFSQRG